MTEALNTAPVVFKQVTEVYGGGAGRDESRAARLLLTPDEVLNLAAEGALLLP